MTNHTPACAHHSRDEFDVCICPERPSNDRAVIADLISQSDNWDAADDAPTTLAIKVDVECPECAHVFHVFRPTYDLRKGEWMFCCPDCDEELGRKAGR